jgi:HK97 family phage major capsid protein
MAVAENNDPRPRNDRSYRGMFYNSDKSKTLDRGEFKHLDEFFSVVGSGRFDERLKRSMTVGTPSQGGFSVPAQFASEWLDSSLENEVIRPRAKVYPMNSETLTIPGWDDLDHTSGQLFGGFTIAWLAEEGTATRQQAKLRQIVFNAHKGAIYVAASREVLQSGLNFNAQLSTALIKGLGYGMDDAFINGDGAGKPLGITHAGSLISVAKETGQTADTIVYENLTKMLARLHPSCVMGAVWLGNPSTLAQLMELCQSVGVGGNTIKALTRVNDQYMLLDRPIYFTEKCPALGELGDLILADVSKYAIGLRQEIAIDSSNAPGWLTDTVDFRVIVRVDGMPVWSKAFTPKNGATQSWAVALATR